jgi:hypothetical protein
MQFKLKVSSMVQGSGDISQVPVPGLISSSSKFLDLDLKKYPHSFHAKAKSKSDQVHSHGWRCPFIKVG